MKNRYCTWYFLTFSWSCYFLYSSIKSFVKTYFDPNRRDKKFVKLCFFIRVKQCRFPFNLTNILDRKSLKILILSRFVIFILKIREICLHSNKAVQVSFQFDDFFYQKVLNSNFSGLRFSLKIRESLFTCCCLLSIWRYFILENFYNISTRFLFKNTLRMYLIRTQRSSEETTNRKVVLEHWFSRSSSVKHSS